MRLTTNLAIILIIGLVLGGLTARFALQRTFGIGAISAGVWSAWPFVGGSEVDPYTAARSTVDGVIPLGAAEGLAFETLVDEQGRALKRECDYILFGNTPAARFWTLTAYDLAGAVIMNKDGDPAALYSGNLVRTPSSDVSITISDAPSSGNWISLSGNGEFKFVLRLYDTPITSSAGLSDPEMPQLQLLECA
ncbi:MAG: DUF1214 domain-containing protein [Pseudomonadota bacterium]